MIKPETFFSKLFISPTVRYQNARQYNPKDKITLESNAPYPVGGEELMQRKMLTEVYPSVAPAKHAFSIEIPIIAYFKSWPVGLEISPKAGVNDSNADNIGLKFGVFLPIQTQKDVPLIIQPIFRLQKLFESSDMDFWKDNVVVGFNLSVNLPKAMGLNKIF